MRGDAALVGGTDDALVKRWLACPRGAFVGVATTARDQQELFLFKMGVYYDKAPLTHGFSFLTSRKADVDQSETALH